MNIAGHSILRHEGFFKIAQVTGNIQSEPKNQLHGGRAILRTSLSDTVAAFGNNTYKNCCFFTVHKKTNHVSFLLINLLLYSYI